MVNLTRSPFGLATRSPNAIAPAACVDPDKLAEALELMKMAKLSSQGRNRRRSLAGKYGEARELMRRSPNYAWRMSTCTARHARRCRIFWRTARRRV